MSKTELDIKVEELLTEYRKTCFIVKDNGLDKEKSIQLMALGHINTKNNILQIIESIIPPEREVLTFSTALKDHRTSEYYEDYGYNLAIKDIRRKL
jgi:hypothetical protein